MALSHAPAHARTPGHQEIVYLSAARLRSQAHLLLHQSPGFCAARAQARASAYLRSRDCNLAIAMHTSRRHWRRISPSVGKLCVVRLVSPPGGACARFRAGHPPGQPYDEMQSGRCAHVICTMVILGCRARGASIIGKRCRTLFVAACSRLIFIGMHKI